MGYRATSGKGRVGTGAVSRIVVTGLLFLGIGIGWPADAHAACPPPATTVFFVNGLDQSIPEAAASLDALAQRLGGQLQGECLNFALAYNSTSTPLTFD
jgi:hypothetical protein